MHCWARYLFYAVVAVLATGQMIAACGQKGPLYLPEKDDKTPASAPAAAPAPEPDPGGEAMQAEDDIPDATPAPVSPAAEAL